MDWRRSAQQTKDHRRPTTKLNSITQQHPTTTRIRTRVRRQHALVGLARAGGPRAGGHVLARGQARVRGWVCVNGLVDGWPCGNMQCWAGGNGPAPLSLVSPSEKLDPINHTHTHNLPGACARSSPAATTAVAASFRSMGLMLPVSMHGGWCGEWDRGESASHQSSLAKI